MILKIIPDGLETETGIIRADIIVLANGFKTNEFLDPLQVHGRDGLSINYALRILAPVLKRKAPSAGVKFDAEKQYVYHVQDELNKRVWSVGCKSVCYFNHNPAPSSLF
jgi:glycine/D-amino acid oxidase-like deaminating enzyme